MLRLGLAESLRALKQAQHWTSRIPLLNVCLSRRRPACRKRADELMSRALRTRVKSTDNDDLHRLERLVDNR